MDEHGRLVTAQEVPKRDEEHVKPVLERLKTIGLNIGTFYSGLRLNSKQN